MALHVYWAVGGTWGLPPAAVLHPSETRVANWFVSAIEMIGALWVLALLHPAARRVPSWLLLLPLWAAAAVCVSHAIFGAVTKALYLGGMHEAVDFPVVPELSAAEVADANHLAAVQDLLVFEPCFLIQGVLLAMAAWQYIQTPARRRLWTWSLIMAVVLVDAFGAVLSFVEAKFAI
ncbi:DUF3995 domain-containing protein [Streptomyces sp. ME01-18a]|uniref:DUF3995 domain-containing protein n=1 Tax=Streptomyces sp. ME01-18a TaxID=3028669 RepID=UPI0029A88E31|nr:DUF3995 domain-containing protein [Streptomyces sp. ME01-18a]MDX3434199.1 DUF3995 domain-containing protein [Streptomyces sp. ME01-18a]